MPAFGIMILFIVFTYIFAGKYTIPEDVAKEIFENSDLYPDMNDMNFN
jgi:hypothetical protein